MGSITADISPVVRRVYDNSLVIDATGSPEDFMGGWPRNHSLLTADELAQITESGVTAIDVTVSDSELEKSIANIAGWHGAIANHPQNLLLVRSVSDITEARNSNRLGIILGFQHTGMMGRNLDWLYRFNDLGIRSIQLTYNKRNKDDDSLRAMANKGGVIGIYFMPFLGDNGSPWATEAMVLDHIDHALKTCGEDHVGIGTDGPIPTVRESKEFFAMMKKVEKQRAAAGVQAPGEQGRFPFIQELNQPRRIEQVAEDMHRRGHPDRVIEKVIGANFYRTFSEIWV